LGTVLGCGQAAAKSASPDLEPRSTSRAPSDDSLSEDTERTSQQVGSTGKASRSDEFWLQLKQTLDRFGITGETAERRFEERRGILQEGERIRQFLKSLVGRLRELANTGEASPSIGNDARDAWIYEQCCAHTIYKKIIRDLKKNQHGWTVITTTNGIKSAASRYANKNNLPEPPERHRGRPKQSKDGGGSRRRRLQ
jgi:hypothetical protein